MPMPCDDCSQLEERQRFYSEQATNGECEESYVCVSAIERHEVSERRHTTHTGEDRRAGYASII